MTAKQTDIVIIGAGSAGLTLAVLLGQAGIHVVIVDPYKPTPVQKIETSGRTVALMNGSVNILKQCGIWDDLKDVSCALEMMRIVDDSDSVRERVEIDFPAGEIDQEQFGYNIPNGFLRSVLFERVQKLKNVHFIEDSFEKHCAKNHMLHVTFKSQKSIDCKLLVGADGRKSAVREFAGIKTSVRKYDQSAITCLINHSRSHNNSSTEFHRENGPMALVPLPGNQSSVVWVERTDKADSLLKLKKSEFERALQRATNDCLGGITLETGPECWPLCFVKAKGFTAQRIALIAEAAHVMSPITAQGLNLSLRDVAALAECIVDSARLGLDIGAHNTLQNYEKRRRVDVETRVFGVDAMNHLVSTHKTGLKRLRRAGLKSLDALPLLKVVCMNVGLAPAIDESRLARGEAL